MKIEGVSTLFICSYLRALNRFLTFEMLCVCLLENTLKIPKYGNFVMILVSVENVYKMFCF